MSRAVIPESSYPHPVREKKRAAAAAVRLGGVAAACAFGLALLGWAGCLPELTPIPPVEAGTEAGEVLPSSYCGDGIIATLDDGGDAGESCDPGDASVLGCRNCQTECEGTPDPTTGHCYFVLPAQAATYNTALSACRAANAHVVTLGTSEEIAFVAEKVAAGRAHWVGLNVENIFQAYKSASDLEPGFPSVPTTGPCEGCFALSGEGGIIAPEADGGFCVASRPTEAGTSWSALGCSGAAQLTTICEREPEGMRTTSCIGGFCFNLVATAGKKTYLLGVDTLTAAEANETCRSLDDVDAGGRSRLAVFETIAEREAIAREIILRYPTDQETTYWIGVSTDDAGTWAWDDGLAVADAGTRRPPWGDKQPVSIDAGAPARAFMRIASIYDVSLAYADSDATSRRRYLCERTPK